MSKYQAIIEEMHHEKVALLKLWTEVGMGEVRVTRHTPGAPEVDVTEDHADSLRIAGNSLNRAILILEGVDA